MYLHGLEHGLSSIPCVISFSPHSSDTFMVAHRNSHLFSSCLYYSRSSIFGGSIHELNTPIRKSSQEADWLLSALQNVLNFGAMSLLHNGLQSTMIVSENISH